MQLYRAVQYKRKKKLTLAKLLKNIFKFYKILYFTLCVNLVFP